MVKRIEAPADNAPQPPSGVEDLSALAGEAAALDQAEAAQASQAVASQEQIEQRRQEQLQDAEAKEVAGLLGVIRDLAGAMAEDAGYLAAGRTRAIWTDARLEGIAGPLVSIMHRHGGSLGEWMQQYGPYLALVAAAAVPAGATIREVREQRQARAKAGETDAAPAPDGTPGSAP